MTDWSWHHDWMLIGEEGDRPIVPGVNTLRLNAAGNPIAVHYSEGARTQRQSMELAARSKTIVAIGGGAPLARLITGGFPPFHEVRILGLRRVSRTIVDDVAGSEYLPRLERLVLRGSGIDDIDRLLASPLLAQLPALVVFDAELAALEAIAARPWPALRELRLIGPYPTAAPEETAACAAAFERLFASLRGQLHLLHVDRFVVPLDALVASPACEGLEELGIERCGLRGGELLGALRELRTLRASASSFDDEAALALARCKHLELVEAAATSVGDAGVTAIATASLPSLRELDLRDTALTDPGALALARTATLPALRQLQLPSTLGWRAVLAGHHAKAPAVRDAVRASIPALATWRPPRPVATPGIEAISTALWHRDAEAAYLHAIERGWWPAPPPAIARRFVFETIEHCSVCGGSSWTPGGSCPHHVESRVLPRHDEAFPHARDVVIAVARTAERFAHAESLALAFVRAQDIVVDTLVWHVFDASWFEHAKLGQPPAAFADLAPPGEILVDTPLWPFVALAKADARTRTDALAHAAAFTELGYWFHSLEGHSLHLVMHGSLGNEP